MRNARGAGYGTLVLCLALVATVAPIVRPATGPRVRHWSIAIRARAALASPGAFRMLGVSWPRTSIAPRTTLARTSTDGNRWTRWTKLESSDTGPDAGTEGNGTSSTDPIWTPSGRFAQFRFVGSVPRGATAHLIDPGPDPATPIAAAEASPSQPRIITRAQWGADESMRGKAPEYAPQLRLAIVHHTATTDSYTQDESDDIIRAIYAYHVNTNGWNDIGYNFLVDRFGQIFEGRFGGIAKAVIGAHAQGFNTGSTGIALLGNFARTKPPSVASSSLNRILAWKLDQGFVDPTSSLVYTSNGSNLWPKGKNVKLAAISGHRDTGKTECPGDPLYASLGYLREAAAADGLPKLYDARVSRPVITPNGDGVADGLRLTGRFTAQMSWTVNVIDASDVVYASMSGSGTALDAAWYGKDSTGAAVPHGEYRFRITARSPAGSIHTGYVPFQVWRYANGTFFVGAPSKKTWVLDAGALRHPSSWQPRSTRYRSEEAVAVPDGVARTYPMGPNLGFRDGSVVSVDSEIYVISDSVRRPTTQATLTRLHYNLDAIIDTTATAVAPNALGQALGPSDGYPDGATLKSSAGREAWVLAGIARPFFSRNVRDSYVIRDVDLAGPADDSFANNASSSPLGFRDGTLIRVVNGTSVYFVSNGKRRPFVSNDEFARMGFKWSNVRGVTPGELALHPEGEPI